MSRKVELVGAKQNMRRKRRAVSRTPHTRAGSTHIKNVVEMDTRAGIVASTACKYLANLRNTRALSSTDTLAAECVCVRVGVLRLFFIVLVKDVWMCGCVRACARLQDQGRYPAD